MDIPVITPFSPIPQIVTSRSWAPFIAFTLALIVGFAAAVYVVPQYVPTIGRFYAAELPVCADANLCEPDDPAVLPYIGDGSCWRKQQFNGQPFQEGYCWKCDQSTGLACTGVLGGGGGGGAGGGCLDASRPWNASFTAPPEAASYRSGTYHSVTAGCGATTEESGSGGTVTDFTPGGRYTVAWNPNADVHCGRYQFDVTLLDSAGHRLSGQGVGVVFNWNVNCGAGTPGPTPTPTHTPTPAPSHTPTPTPTSSHTPTPTPTPTPTHTPTPPPTPTPTSSISALICAPVLQTVAIGQTAALKAGGGSATYSWFAPSSAALTQVGSTVSVRYDRAGTFTVTVQNKSGQSSTCTVLVPATPTPTPSVSPTVPALTVQKTVRNITQNGTEADSVSANPSDTVEFSIRISSVGSGPATDVVVRDTLPSGLIYQPGTTIIDTIPAADGIIATGLNLGTLQTGRTVIIRFRATVAPESYFNAGTTVLTNIGSVYASNVGQLTDTARVVVTRSSIAIVPTGPGESTLLALIISAIVTLLYVGYTGTGSFRIHEADVLARRAREDKDRFNFKG